MQVTITKDSEDLLLLCNSLDKDNPGKRAFRVAEQLRQEVLNTIAQSTIDYGDPQTAKEVR